MMSTQKETSNTTRDLLDLPHHHQLELCRTRLPYRQGRQLTAVKTYSVSSESTHLLIFGVPKINLRQELKSLVQKYGKILSLTLTNSYPVEDFTECFHVNYEKFQSARIAKKALDTRSFYGGSLHVCYAPELETIEETRKKLMNRKVYVSKQLHIINKETKEHLKKVNNILSDFNVPGFTNCPSTSSSSHEPQKHYDAYITDIQQYNINNSQLKTFNVPTMLNTVVQDEVSVGYHNFNNVYENSNIETVQCDNAVPVALCNNDEKSSNNKRCAEEDVEYVFKRKKKRRKKNKSLYSVVARNISLNQVSNEMTVCPTNSGTSDCQQVDTGQVVVFNKNEVPKIKSMPKKAANKIILKINTKLI